MDAPYFNGCLQKASELPGFAEMSKTEQLEAFNKSFKELKRADLLAKREAARARKAAEQQSKQQGKQQGKQEGKNLISLT